MNIKHPFLAVCGISLITCQILSAYDLHEWGTFTTVSGSDGGLLAGLHVEEEHLPSFVHSHVGMAPKGNLSFGQAQLMRGAGRNNNQFFVMLDGKKVLQPMVARKGLPSAILSNVTVKMETPVIYFYGDDTPKVNVKVGFNGGTISQWYPQRKSGDTPNKVSAKDFKLSESLQKIDKNLEMILYSPIDFSKPYDGAIEWDVEIIPKASADPAFTFKPDENNSWIYPRVRDANMIKVGDEYEDFLFYRGIGNFELPAIFSVDSEETLNVANRSKEAIPFVFAFENINGLFRYKTIGSISAGEVAKVTENEWIKPSEPQSQQVEVFQQMRTGLIAQGLTADEANGMIKTWWKSYFNKPGLRVFWVVPQTDLERILPLAVDPSPAMQVRVLVGRADIMRPKFEQQMIANLGTHSFSSYRHDRFIQPYMNRLRQLVKKPVYQKFDKQNLANIRLNISAEKGSSVLAKEIYFSLNKNVKSQDFKLSGPWEVIGDDKLKIGETVFRLDPVTGILTVRATTDLAYDTYEIQLPKVLN